MLLKLKMQNKKAELPFWIVLMIVALVFGLVVMLISSGAIKDFTKSLTNIKDKTTAEQDCLTSPNSLGDTDGDGRLDSATYKNEKGQDIDCDPDA